MASDAMSFQVPTRGLASCARTGLETAKKINSKRRMVILTQNGRLGDSTVLEQFTPQAVARPLRVRMRNALAEHLSSAIPHIPDVTSDTPAGPSCARSGQDSVKF